MDPCQLSVVEMAAALRAKTLSSRELVETHLSRIRAHAALNAVVTLDEERALSRARAADEAAARGDFLGRLHGVPFTLKDMHLTAGVRTTAGIEPLADNVPDHDGPIAARLHAAGAILLGKTNMAMNVESDNTLFGRPLNPYAPATTAGGSSGGAAAAVAARLSPFDVGTDLSGSIRMPAHFCGVFGLKPTLHRISANEMLLAPGVSTRADRWLGVCGPMARSAEDCALLLEVLAGAHPGDSEVPPVPVKPMPGRRPDSLKLMLSTELDGIPTSKATRAALEALAESLRAAGATVEEVAPPVPFEQVRDEFRSLIRVPLESLGGTASAPPGLESLGAEPTTIADLTRALDARERMLSTFHAFLDGCDGWLHAAAPCEAFAHRPLGMPVSFDGREHPSQVIDWPGIAATYTGCPALVLPIAMAGELPIGAQLMTPRWSDEHALGVGRAIAEVAGPLPPPVA